MATITDRTKNGIPQEGSSSFADISADDPSRINLNALFFMASVPPKYQALIAPTLAIQADKVKLEQKHKHDHQIELETRYQEAAERHILKLTIDGEDIEISQADLSKVMKSRVRTLEEQREALQRSGKNPVEMKRIGELIEQYKPVITNIDAGKDDPGTMGDVQRLMKLDPNFRHEVKSGYSPHVQTADKKTSFASEIFSDGNIAAPPLKNDFAKGAAPMAVVQAPPEAPAVSLEKRQQNLDNNFTTLGI